MRRHTVVAPQPTLRTPGNRRCTPAHLRTPGNRRCTPAHLRTPGNRRCTQPTYASAVPQFSRDPQSVASSAPAMYAPMGTASPAQPSSSGLRNIVIGFGIALVGTIVTVVSYNSSGPGGTFVVAWGAILFGVIQGIRGIVQQLKG